MFELGQYVEVHLQTGPVVIGRVVEVVDCTNPRLAEYRVADSSGVSFWFLPCELSAVAAPVQGDLWHE